MADIKLFNIQGEVKQIESSNVLLERYLQNIIENNMQRFFGVRFLASEYSTNNSGRMDSIGIDENYCPVIFEYKRTQNENVINQGLFYLDWLLSHQDSFKVLVIDKIGIEIANKIDWSMPRVICIAGDFNKYDESAINQMNRNISLIRYKKFGNELLMFEQVNQNIVKPIVFDSNIIEGETKEKRKISFSDMPFDEKIEMLNNGIKELYFELRDYIIGLGDITEIHLKQYIAYKKISNIATVELQKTRLRLFLKLDADTFEFEEGFTRNVKSVGHCGTGDIEVSIQTSQDIEKAKQIIYKAYNEN